MGLCRRRRCRCRRFSGHSKSGRAHLPPLEFLQYTLTLDNSDDSTGYGSEDTRPKASTAACGVAAPVGAVVPLPQVGCTLGLWPPLSAARRLHYCSHVRPTALAHGRH